MTQHESFKEIKRITKEEIKLHDNFFPTKMSECSVDKLYRLQSKERYFSGIGYHELPDSEYFAVCCIPGKLPDDDYFHDYSTMIDWANEKFKEYCEEV